MARRSQRLPAVDTACDRLGVNADTFEAVRRGAYGPLGSTGLARAGGGTLDTVAAKVRPCAKAYTVARHVPAMNRSECRWSGAARVGGPGNEVTQEWFSSRRAARGRASRVSRGGAQPAHSGARGFRDDVDRPKIDRARPAPRDRLHRDHIAASLDGGVQHDEQQRQKEYPEAIVEPHKESGPVDGRNADQSLQKPETRSAIATIVAKVAAYEDQTRRHAGQRIARHSL